MKQGYDVVVIGSGIGGMTAAVLLACDGYKTLLVESLERLGGRFSTIEYRGYKLPTGAVAIEDQIDWLFKHVGARFDVNDVSRHFCWADGKYFELPLKGQIAALLTILEKLEGDRAKIMGQLAREVAVQKITSVFRRAGREETVEKQLSFRQWLQQHTDNERVLQAFHALTSALSLVNDYELPAHYWFEFMPKAAQRGTRQFRVSANGNVKLAESLAEVIRAKGGQVWTNCPAKQILVKNGAVSGVVVRKDGQEVEIDTRVVICNAGPKKTVALAGVSSFTPEYLKEVNDKIRPVPIIATLIGSDKPVIEVPGGVVFVGLRRVVTGIPMTYASPDLAPPGKHLTVVWATPESCLHPVDKNREIEQTTLDLRQAFPDFEKYGEILSMEVRDIDHEFPGCRTWPGFDLDQKTPVQNLYNVGDGAKPYGWFGMPACLESGRVAFEEVKKRIRPGLA